jgi:hypothetical protein
MITESADSAFDGAAATARAEAVQEHYHITHLKGVASQTDDFQELWRNFEILAAGILTQLKGLPLEVEDPQVIDSFRDQYRKIVLSARTLRDGISGFATSSASEIEAHNALRNIATRSWQTLDTALANAPDLKNAVSRICIEHQKAESRIVALWEQGSEVARELERPWPESTPCATLQQALVQERHLHGLIDQMAAEALNIVSAGKTEVEAELSALENQFDFNLLDNIWNQQRNELRQRVANISRTSQLREVRAVIAEFRAQIAAKPEVQRITDLAASALSADAQASTILPVIQALNRRKRFSEALALLNIMQNAFPVEETDISDFSTFVDAVLEAATGACHLETNKLWWPKVVLDQPWIASLGGSDMADQTVQRKLAVCIILLAQHRETDAWKPHFFRLDMWALFEHTGTPSLQSLITEMVEGHPAKIADGDHDAALAKAEAKIVEFFHYDSQHAEFSRQVTKKHVLVVERDEFFPKLQSLTAQIQDFCAQRRFENAHHLINNMDAERLWAESCKSRGVDPWKSHSYIKAIFGVNGYVADLKAILKRYIHTAEGTPSDPRISAELVRADLRTLAAVSPPCVFWDQAISDVTSAPLPMQAADPFGSLLARLCETEPPAAALAARFVLSLCKDPRKHQVDQLLPDWNRSLLRDALTLLPERHYDRRPFDILKTGSCLCHAVHIARLIPELQIETGDFAQQSDAKLEELRRQLVKRKDKPSVGATIEEVTTWLEWSCIPAVETWLAQQIDQDRQLSAKSESERRRKLDSLLEELSNYRVLAMAADIEDKLQEKMLALVNAIEIQAVRIKRLSLVETDADASLARLETLTDSMRLIAEHRDPRAVAELSTELVIDASPSTTQSQEMGSASADVANNLSESDQKRICDAAASWEVLGGNWPLDRMEEDSKVKLGAKVNSELQAKINELQDEIRHFLNAFSGRCRLYASDWKRVDYEPLGQTILTVCITALRNPKNRYLTKPLALFVLPGNQPFADHIDAVETWIDAHRDFLNIVLVPGKAAARSRLREFESTTTIVIGYQDLMPLLEGPHFDSSRDRLRQTYVRRVARAAVPYRAEGAVHFENDLFAGRADELETLVNRNGYFLCGGRRTGKTSLMHALKHRLSSSSSSSWRVAYIDGQIYRDVRSNSVGHWDLESWQKHAAKAQRPAIDPDLAVAREIASELSIERPADLDDFRHKIDAALAEANVAILIDEIDCYIHASRWYHGDQRLPLMSCLRSMHFRHPDKLKIVFAGFKDLFFESNRKDITEAAGPFGNWLEYMPVGTLPYRDAADDLIREGLVKQMGFKIEPKACMKIWELASGHPAFIQTLCSMIAAGKQSESELILNIELADVMRAYENTKSLDGKVTYLSFVDRTLGLNLDALERTIILTIAQLFREEAERGSPLAQHRIVEGLQDIFLADNLEVPSPDHLHWAFLNLDMAGMLRKVDGAHLTLAYSSYFDILTRLNRLVKENNKSNLLDDTIREYDKMRHAVKQSLL